MGYAVERTVISPLRGRDIVAVVLWRPEGLIRRTPTGVARRLPGWTLVRPRPARGQMAAENALAPPG